VGAATTVAVDATGKEGTCTSRKASCSGGVARKLNPVVHPLPLEDGNDGETAAPQEEDCGRYRGSSCPVFCQY
jgi:hypothetical protein